MIVPPHLNPGDTIAIVASARKVAAEDIAPGIQWLKKQGFKVVLGNSVQAAQNQFAGSDQVRADDLQQFLDSSGINAIWCARGGYGTLRIIDALDFTQFVSFPKWIIGYSDVTVLHNHIHRLGIATLHAPLVFDILKQPVSVQNQVINSLTGKNTHLQITPSPQNRKGRAEGILTGGNLSILYSLMGSNSAVDTTGKILFIEDLDEYLYHTDRMMQSLKRSGVFDGLAGLIVGGMTGMKDNTREFGATADNPFGKTAEEIIREAVAEYNFPVCFNFPAGHVPENNPLVFGKKAVLTVTNDDVFFSYAPIPIKDVF